METWKTYTPDGRVLDVEYAEGEWVARCEGARGSGRSAHDAIAAALGTEEASIGTPSDTVEAWVAAHAAQLEEDVG